MRYSAQVQTCGYESCTCRGINFISGDGTNLDFCDNGKRVQTRNKLVPRSIFLHQLDKYAEYCRWHQQNELVRSTVPLSPFEYREINAARANEVRTRINSDYNPQAVRGEHFV